MTVKTDRNDAPGLAQLMRMGWFRPVHAKSMGALAEDGNQLPAKATKELSPQLLSLLPQRNMPRRSPILIRIFKEESELEVWKQDTTGRFELLKLPYFERPPSNARDRSVTAPN
jgi:hypothetical protein